MRWLAETCSTVLLKTNTKGCSHLRHKHAHPYVLRSITLFFHKHSWRARKHENPDSSTNRYPINKLGKAMNLYPDVTLQMTKNSFFSVSIVRYLFCAGHSHISTRPHPDLRPCVDSKRKEELFNPILPALWHCWGNYCFFAWGRSKSAALFCLY